MPTLTKRGAKHPADLLVVCLESFNSSHELGGCAKGARLLGDHAHVIRWPQFFADADLPDDQLERLRKRLYPEGQAFNK